MPDNSTSSLFFAVAIAATFGYALQSTLMTSFYRSMDRLSAVAYRGLSLGITMLPLLFFVPYSELNVLSPLFYSVAAASFCAALGNWCAANAYSHLPVGIASALSMSFATIVVVVFGYLLFDESLSTLQLILIFGILGAVFGLGVTKSTGSLPDEFSIPKGALNSLLFGIFLGTAYSIIAQASRDYHPFLVGYLWEFTIGIFALLFCCARKWLNASGIERIGVKRFARLSAYSAPTVVGTGAYAMATTLGPVGIATAIIGTLMVFNAVLARFLYGERLSKVRWV